MDLAAFRLMFPAFACMTDAEIQAYETLACAIHGDFCYVPDGKAKDLMVMLAVAHEIHGADPMLGGAVKRIENQQDSIEYARDNSSDIYGLLSSPYGSRLEKLMKVYCFSSGFITAGTPTDYTSDIGYFDDCCCW